MLRVLNQGCNPTCWLHAGVHQIENIHARTDVASKTPNSVAFLQHNLILEKAGEAWRNPEQTIEWSGWIPDAIKLIRNYGTIPDSAWNPKIPSANWELKKVIEPKIRELAAYHRIHGTWESFGHALHKYLDSYYGRPPTKFTFNGETLTPQTFRDRYSRLGDPKIVSEEIVVKGKQAVDSADLKTVVETFEEAESQILRWLDGQQPVGFTYLVHKGEFQADQALWSLANEQTEHPAAHAVIIVGYIKDLDGRAPIAYKALNSWGTERPAGDGYLVLSREFVRQRLVSFSLISANN